MTKNILYVGFLILALGGIESEVRADVKLSQLFGDNMVLQREIPVPVWGWADQGEHVTVSFGNQKKSATAGADGKWLIKLDPLIVNAVSAEMTVAGKNTLTIKNILVGDVWICSGQSNMQMTVIQSLNGKSEAESAEYSGIRMATVPCKAEDFLVEDVKVSWQECSPKTAGNFSATAYFFARTLFNELHVPIGLINTSWGGTQIAPWISPAGYRSLQALKNISTQIDSWDSSTETGNKNWLEYMVNLKEWQAKAEKAVAERAPVPPMPEYPGKSKSHQEPTKIYNSMINPLIPYAMRGVLWYQGESNGGEGMSYFNSMQALISGWRELWKQGDFPFYYVQLPGWQNSDVNNPAGADGWSRCREAQRRSLSIANTGMAIVIDLGDNVNIHPMNKQDVGKRLALLALGKEFKKEVVFSGPLYKDMKIEGNRIRISFDSFGSGLMIGEKKGLDPVREIKEGKVKWVSISGKDKKWYWADMVIDGNTIVVSSDKVPEPLAVRYAYTMNPVGPLLYNKEGLPASPFTTETVWQ